jgi:hypothetical protein
METKVAQVFCMQFIDLMTQLCMLYPEETDFEIFKTSLETVLKTNPGFVVEQFIIHVYPYKSKIENNDESFFLSNDLIEKEASTVQDACVNKTFIMDKFFKIKEKWNTSLVPENKEKVWKYLNTLIKVAEKWYVVKQNNTRKA